MEEPEYAHLESLAHALRAKGGHPEGRGFEPARGGWACHVPGRLDMEMLAAMIESDPQRHKMWISRQMLFCGHCWAVIHGAPSTP